MAAWAPAFRTALVSPYETESLIPPRSFEDHTLRQVFHLAAAGERIRLRLSNLFGKEPLLIGRTTIGDGFAVRFDGQTAVTIPAGAELVSDPVNFPVEAGADLAVSLDLPKPTGPATYHGTAQQIARLFRGGRQVDELPSWYFLSGVDVDVSTPRPVLAAFGDSLIEGAGTTTGANLRFADQLRVDGMTVLNLGIGGNRLLGDEIGERGVTRFAREVLPLPKVTQVVVHLGLNDLGLPGLFGFPRVTAADLIAGYERLFDQGREAGLKVRLATLAPCARAAYEGFFTAEGEENRQAVNRWIRDSPEFVDFDAVLSDSANALRAEFDSGDGVHPNDAGARAMAEAV
jgi:lysophospholipase L1-like esterase